MMATGDQSGAQTERRGGAGPVGGLLGGKDPTGRLLVSVYTFAELAFISAINRGIAFSKLPR